MLTFSHWITFFTQKLTRPSRKFHQNVFFFSLSQNQYLSTVHGWPNMSWSNVWNSLLGKLSTRQNLKKSLKEWDCEHKFKKGKDDPCSEMAFLQISTCTVCWGRQQPENKTLCRKEIMHFCSQLFHHFVQVLVGLKCEMLEVEVDLISWVTAERFGLRGRRRDGRGGELYQGGCCKAWDFKFYSLVSGMWLNGDWVTWPKKGSNFGSGQLKDNAVFAVKALYTINATIFYATLNWRLRQAQTPRDRAS